MTPQEQEKLKEEMMMEEAISSAELAGANSPAEKRTPGCTCNPIPQFDAGGHAVHQDGCGLWKTSTEKAGEDLVEKLSGQVIDIIFNREAGWSEKLEAIRTTIAEAERRRNGELRESIRLQLKEFANTPLDKRRNGWDELIAFRDKYLTPH